MNIHLKNFIFLTDKELNQLAIITSKEEIMKYIASGKPYSKKDLLQFKKDEFQQNKLKLENRKFWTYAVMLDKDVVGMFVLYKINLARYNLKPIAHSKLTRKTTKKTTRKTKKTTQHNNQAVTIATRILIDTAQQGKGISVIVYNLAKQMIKKQKNKKPLCLISFVADDNIPGNKLQVKAEFELFATSNEKGHKYNVYRWYA